MRKKSNILKYVFDERDPRPLMIKTIEPPYERYDDGRDIYIEMRNIGYHAHTFTTGSKICVRLYNKDGSLLFADSEENKSSTPLKAMADAINEHLKNKYENASLYMITKDRYLSRYASLAGEVR